MATNNAIDIGVVPGGGFTYTFPSATSTLYGTGTGTITSAQLATSLTDETGTGVAVFATSPTLVTPVLGVATATSINKVAITAPATSATLTIANGKTLTVNNSLTLQGTDATTMTFPTTTATIARTDAAQTFTGVQTLSSSPVLSTNAITGSGANTVTLFTSSDTVVGRATTDTLSNKNIQRRVVTVNAPGATPTTTMSTSDIANFTGVAANITSMTTNLSTTGAVDGQLIEYRFLDNGTARTISWGASFSASTVALPITTVISTVLRVLFEYNGSVLVCIAVA